MDKWSWLRSIRESVNKSIESLRVDGKVGSSLQAEVTLSVAEGAPYDTLKSLGDDLKFVLLVSKVGLVKFSAELYLTSNDGGDIEVQVTNVIPSNEKKCERCWHYREDVGIDAAHPGICGRCTSNLYGAGETRTFA